MEWQFIRPNKVLYLIDKLFEPHNHESWCITSIWNREECSWKYYYRKAVGKSNSKYTFHEKWILLKLTKSDLWHMESQWAQDYETILKAFPTTLYSTNWIRNYDLGFPLWLVKVESFVECYFSKFVPPWSFNNWFDLLVWE